MIIEREDEEEDNEEVVVSGELVKTQARRIYFQDYDALGYWCQTPTAIKVADITILQFDTPYINIFSKYTREVYYLASTPDDAE